MKREHGLVLGACALCCFLIGFPIWAGVYFGIYQPLISKEWTVSVCVVTDIEQYFTGYNVEHIYTQYKVGVLVNGKVLPGYACESSENRSAPSSNNEDNYYPYQYPDCSKAYVQHGVCRPGQLFLPRWMCTGYKGIPQYTEGDMVQCKYYINGDSSAAQFSYPKHSTTFVEVLFQDQVFIPQGDYYATWVIPFGLMSILPCLLLILIGIPAFCGLYQGDEVDKYSDCLERYLCCRRHLKPRLLRNIDDIDKFEPLPMIVWLFTYQKRHEEVFTFGHNIAREVADYLDSPLPKKK